MIPPNIEKMHVIDAMRKIDSDGFPSGRGSKKFLLDFEGKRYPPKYVISEAVSTKVRDIVSP
jgi:5-methylcytosine-specific restriction protein B